MRPRAKEISQDADPLFEVFDLSATVESARNSFGQDHPFIDELTRTAGEINEGVERVQEVFSRLLMSAGLGHMVDVVIHEIGRPLGSINRRVISIQKMVNNHCDETDKIESHLLAIKGAAEDIHNLRERLDPQTPAKRGRAETFDVFQEIEDNFALYEALIRKQRIEYQVYPENTKLRVKMARSSLGQIMANLIDNSIYWIIREKGTGNGGYIRVNVEESDRGFRILFSDDGPGIDPEYQKDIFEPYVTRKPNGIGLGLYIARLIIEPYGKITYRDECDLPGACFEIMFEHGVGR